MYCYWETEPGLWTVGFYDPQKNWHPESDHDDPDKAAKRVNYLNGGKDHLEKRIDELEKSVYQAANTASCLANGIIPD